MCHYLKIKNSFRPRMNLRLLNIMIFLILFSNVYSQNLVPNPSFEDMISCPQWVGDFTVSDWIKPTWGSSDYFHTCSWELGIPQNVFGWQHPRTGNAYVGAHGSNPSSGSNAREYIQCQLISPLEAGELYEVSFWVSRTDSSTYAVDNVGAYLSTTAISRNDGNPFVQFTPQVVSNPNEPVTDAVNWVQIVDTIMAIGSEQYLTIGVFSDDANTNWTPVSGGWNEVFHYYYDDVSVIKITTNSIHGLGKNNVSVFPNPSNGIVTITSGTAIESYEVYSLAGQVIASEDVNYRNTVIDLTMHPAGLYVIGIKTNELTSIKKIIINQ